MPMNVKEVYNFFGDQLAIFCPNFIQNCEFRLSSKMLNFAISFVFRPKRISCVPNNVPLHHSLMPISCHFQDRALLLTTTANIQIFTFILR